MPSAEQLTIESDGPQGRVMTYVVAKDPNMQKYYDQLLQDFMEDGEWHRLVTPTY